MLTDLERDVLFLVESAPGFEGAWRILPPAGAADPFEIAVAVRDCATWRVHLEVMKLLRPDEQARVWVFDPAVGTSPSIGSATPIALDDVERARAERSVASRPAVVLDGPLVIEEEARARRTILVVERERSIATQLAARAGPGIAVHRDPTAFDAAQSWWWSNRDRAADVVVLDLDVRDAVKLAPSLTCQPRYVGRLFFATNGRTRFPFVHRVGRELSDADIDAILAAANGPPIASMLGAEPDLPCVVVVDTKRGFGREVRTALDDAEVVICDDGSSAVDLVTQRRVDWVIFVFVRRGDAERFQRFYKLLIELRGELRDRILFVTDAETKARLDRERPSIAARFIALPMSHEALRARLLSPSR